MEISAKIISHSKSSVNGKEIITFELQYPRFIHSELMTHRVFSRNAASSRAIPIGKMIEQVRNDPAMPIHWGKNQPGMQAKEELDDKTIKWAKAAWLQAAEKAIIQAEYLNSIGAHKQIINRILEPYQWMKTVLTATEFENFFWLRNHEDAQPEIKRLAEVMFEAKENSEPVVLNPGDWHTPYYADGYWRDDSHSEKYATHTWLVKEEDREDFDGVKLKDALAISSSCCAQVSYRALDDSLEKAQMIYKKLVESEPVHASPFEHQATPIKETNYKSHDERSSVNDPDWTDTWEKGITHKDVNYTFWSGNFAGWIQHRQIISNNVKRG